VVACPAPAQPWLGGAGLQGIPPELREAAAIDGASSWQITRRIMLPLLGPTIRIWIFLAVIGSLQLFDIVWIMTLGGPANASQTMLTCLYFNGAERTQFGYGATGLRGPVHHLLRLRAGLPAVRAAPGHRRGSDESSGVR
jgi:ABC-type glycerol-3-phosphate transport system permease component